MSVEISITDSESILSNFNEIKDGEFADLSAALRDLSSLPETLAAGNPPMLPSQITQVISTIGRSAKRTAAIVTAASSALVATALAAAAITGVGPKPVVNFAKSTVRAIEDTTKKIFNVSLTPEVIATPVGSATPSAVPIPSESASVAESHSPAQPTPQPTLSPLVPLPLPTEDVGQSGGTESENIDTSEPKVEATPESSEATKTESATSGHEGGENVSPNPGVSSSSSTSGPTEPSKGTTSGEGSTSSTEAKPSETKKP